MAMRVNKQAYQQLIEEDIKWLRDHAGAQSIPGCLEAGHIALVLEESVNLHFGIPVAADKLDARLVRKLAEDLCASFNEGATDFDELEQQEQGCFESQARELLLKGVAGYFHAPMPPP